MMTELALLSTALLFGGTVLFSFGFAAFVFTSLPAETAGPLIRKAFPHFYLFVFFTSALGCALSLAFDLTSALILGTIALTTVIARQIVTPAVNVATDLGAKGRFKALHSLSVLITLLHIALAGIGIIRIGGAV